jgi:hypothetical protein
LQKERQLRSKNRGTLHRAGPKRPNKEKWVHNSFKGWIQFQRCLGGVCVAMLQTRNPDEQWQLLTAFLGFLDRHFRAKISSAYLNYDCCDED